MHTEVNCRKIVPGIGISKALVTNNVINFLAMVDTKSATIIDKHHELYGKSIKGIILVFPNAIGSSVGAYAIYSLKINRVAPSAIICINNADIITASGCAISDIPLVDMLEKPSSFILESEMEICVDADKELVTIQTV
jgi:phosphomecalonate degydratase small subunit